MQNEDDNGRCPECGEDEMDGARCYYCGFHDYDCELPDCEWCLARNNAKGHPNA